MSGDSRLRLFVGSYSRPVPHAPTAHGAGLSVIDVDLEAGTARTRVEYPDVLNPSYLCVSADGRLVYVTSERYDADGTVSSIEFDDDYLGVRRRCDLPTGGTVASYVSVADARTLLVSNYGDGSLASFSLGDDGHLDSRRSLLRLTGSGPDADRQEGPHAHCILVRPGADPATSRSVYAADLGADTLIELALHDGLLTVASKTLVPPGSGPRHLAFDRGGSTAFVVNELTSRLGVYRVDHGGALIGVQDLPMLPPGVGASSFGADVAITADGRVFASNRGHDSVVSYGRNESGEYRPETWHSTGAIPRGLALTPDDRHLVVANQESDTIQIFEIGSRGDLTVVLTIDVATPVCVKCVAPAVTGAT